jgi:hypothetical protein
MARYTVTLVFTVPAGTSPRGPDVLARLPLPPQATYRRSSCDGSTLTVVVDFRSSHPASVCRQVAHAARGAWAEVSGAEPGDPTSVRVRPLRPPHPVPGAAARSREYIWRRDEDGDGDGRLVLVDAGSDPVSPPNDVEPVEQGDSAHPGRPRRPVPGLGPLRNALPLLPRRHRG